MFRSVLTGPTSAADQIAEQRGPIDRIIDARAALILFALVAAGIGLSWNIDVGSTALLGMAAGCAGLSLILKGRWSIAALCAAALLATAGWTELRLDQRPSRDVRTVLELPTNPAAWRGGVPVRVEGIVLDEPERRGARGSLAEFARLGRDRAVPFAINRVEVARDVWQTATGTAHATLGDRDQSIGPDDDPWQRGNALRVRGMLKPSTPRLNPGEADTARWAAQGNRVGVLATSSSLATPISESRARTRLRSTVIAARGWLTDRAERALDRAAPPGAGGGIVRAMLLGETDPDADELRGAFQRVGVSHVLAISGFHLVVMAGLVVGVVRLTGDRGWLEPAIAATLIVAYLLILPVRPPVWRAGLMAIALLAAMAAGRRYEPLAVLACVATALLLWRPMDLAAVGFLLSVGVTGGLILFATPMQARLWGTIDRPTTPLSRPAALARGVRTRCTIGLTVAVVAWLIAAPIAAAGIGVVSPFGVLATIIVTPIVTVMLWLGYTALALGVLIPSSAALLAPLLAGATAATTWVVRTVDRVPGAFTQAPPVSTWWAASAVVVAALAMGGARRLIWIPALAVVIAWGAGEWLVRRDAGDALRVDMLAVGDGSAILLRSGNDAMLWDCGSMSSDLGMRTIPAACSALGATRVGRAIITHADFDHFSALPDAAQRLGIRTVYIGPTVVEQSAMPTTASAVLVDQLTQMDVAILPLSQGDSLTVGAATLRVIAPGPGLDDEADNDRALAALVELPRAGREPARVLLPADSGPTALRAMLDAGLPPIDVLELPHHGSWNDVARELVETLDPSHVLQSTGWRRVGDQRWRDARSKRWWAITARDGAAWVRLDTDGAITAGTTRDAADTDASYRP